MKSRSSTGWRCFTHLVIGNFFARNWMREARSPDPDARPDPHTSIVREHLTRQREVILLTE